jgi:hypothetical protein
MDALEGTSWSLVRGDAISIPPGVTMTIVFDSAQGHRLERLQPIHGAVSGGR